MTIKTAIIFIIIFFGILLFTKNSQAATYYVKNGGNDNAAGTSDATAWARAPGMVGWSGSASLQSGDIVYFRSQDTWTITPVNDMLRARAGVTYDGSSWGTGTRAKLVANSGSNFGFIVIQESNVTFRGFEVNGNRKSIGGGSGAIDIGYGNYTFQNISNITIDNNIIHDTYVPSYGYGIHVGGFNLHSVSNVTITNNLIYNTGHEGIAIYPTSTQSGNVVDTVLIRGNEVHHTGLDEYAAFGVGILFKDEIKNVTAEFNYVHNTSQGIEFEGIAMPAPTNITVRYNIVKDNDSVGLWFINSGSYSFGANIYGNILINNGGGGNRYGNLVWPGGGQNQVSSNINLYNNIIYCTNPAITHCVRTDSGSSGTPKINFKNNIVYTNSIVPIEDEKGWFTHSNNLVYRTDSSTATHVISGSNSYNRSGVLTWEPTAQNTDPTFKNISSLPTGFTGTYGSSMVPNTDGLSISSGNAIDRGVTLASPYNGAINLSGKGQTRSGAFDIGAYEYVSSSPPPPDTTPPTPPTGVQIQ